MGAVAVVAARVVAWVVASVGASALGCSLGSGCSRAAGERCAAQRPLLHSSPAQRRSSGPRQPPARLPRPPAAPTRPAHRPPQDYVNSRARMAISAAKRVASEARAAEESD